MNILAKHKKKIIAAAILVVLAVGVSFLSVFAVNHYQGSVRLVNRYVDAINNRDAKQLIQCLSPDSTEQLQANIEALGGEEAFFDQIYSMMFEGSLPYDSFGENVTISVSDTEPEQQTITDGIYRGLDVSQMNVSAISVVHCNMTTKGTVREVTEAVDVYCMKIDGDWYLMDMVAVSQTTETPTDAQ